MARTRYLSRYRPFIGQRTTFRILNKKHALKLQALGRGAAPGRPRFHPATSEAFVLWHHASVAQGPALAREFPENRLFFFSADLINWQARPPPKSLFLAQELFLIGLWNCYK